MPNTNSFENEIRKILKELWIYSKLLLNQIVNLRKDTDIEGTIIGIKKGIVLEGSNLWILICSTIIACIGLDTNSPAVIIGAMLISPLMSPILGIGLSVGINDTDYIKKSLNNFIVAIALSLFVSILYFKLTPFGNFTDEMKVRIAPTILDAFVALFGGLAGIIAGSRTDKTNAIPGVAIATALMPPLCTAGFGIARWRWDIFGGAFYLFFINTILITLSTYFIVRILKFPLIKELNPKTANKTKRWAYIILIILLIPSILFLVSSLRKASLDNTLRNFIAKYIHEDVEQGVRFKYESLEDTTFRMKVYYFGPYIEADTVNVLEKKLLNQFDNQLLINLYGYKQVELELTPTDAPPDEEKQRIVQELADISSNIIELKQKQKEQVENSHIFIHEQSGIIDSLNGILQDSIPLEQITKEVKALYDEINSLYLSKTGYSNFDTLNIQYKYIALIKWNRNRISRKNRQKAEMRLNKYLQTKLKSTNLEVFGY